MPLFICDSSYIDIDPKHYGKLLEFNQQVLESKAFHEDIEALRVRFMEGYVDKFQWHGVMARAAKFTFEENNEYSVHYNIIFNGLLPEQSEKALDANGTYGILGCGESQSPKMYRDVSARFPLGFERMVKVCDTKADVYRAFISPGKQAEWNLAMQRLEEDVDALRREEDGERILEEAQAYTTDESTSELKMIGHYGFLKFMDQHRPTNKIRLPPLSLSRVREFSPISAWDRILSMSPKQPIKND